MSGTTTPLATNPYPLKKQKISSSKTMTSAPPSTPQPMALSPPSTAMLPSSPSSCESRSNLFRTNGSSWPNEMKNSPASGQEESKPWPASYPTRGASTMLSLRRTGPLWSHTLYDAGGEGRLRWWQEGSPTSQSTSQKSTLLPITHASQLTPWGHGSFSC